ncbi:response regulator transcription factor [Shewanella sp. Isolate11]|uniref:response regulator transcription factor n=1 Tax=Shewanella sp. Isolate11 TaxID=2908530 RepID=UPI001EFEC4BC|nr:response regulator transcription factor [Shewanella sp. Isolate11]MCG9696721.1 response regulator transcription factor [Shewanella sp. Isolate11]
MNKVLLVDDDFATRAMYSTAMTNAGFKVNCAGDGQQALAQMEHDLPDIIILDVDMPNLDGFGFLKSRVDKLPVIMISATNNESTRVKGFELGADDYLCKPFSVKELTVRIAALQRRVDIVKAEQQRKSVRFNPIISLDEASYSVEFEQSKVVLTETEFNLFKYLFDRQGEVISKAELQWGVLKKELGQFDRNLDMHISNTRKKLANMAIPKSIINTVRGKGYSFCVN